MTIQTLMIFFGALFLVGAFLGLLIMPKVQRRLLRNSAQSYLSEGETVRFESLARRSPSWWQQLVLVNGLILVTSRRLIWVGWLLPLVVKRFTDVKPEQIDSVALRGAGVEVIQGRRVLTFYPQTTPPFSNPRLVQALFDALSNLKGAY